MRIQIRLSVAEHVDNATIGLSLCYSRVYNQMRISLQKVG